VFVVALAIAATALPAADNPFVDRYVAALEEAGVAPDAEGLAAYLALHHPGEDQQQEYRRLIALLADDDFFLREDAMLQLIRMPVHVAGELQKATGSADPEVRWRASVVLEQTSQPRNDLLYAAYVVIQDRKVPGLAAGILGTVTLCHNDHLRLAMNRALEATATPQDADLLRRHLAADDVYTRVSAASALGRTLGEAAAEDLAPLLDDSEDLVRLTAAELLVRTGHPAALRTLGALLDSQQLSIRNRSIQLLRSSLKVILPYSGYEPEEERTRNAEVWRKAIDEHLGAAAAVREFDPRLFGNVLVCRYQGNEVAHFDAEGKLLQAREVAGPRDGRLLADGHWLVVLYRDFAVTELDRDGREVWRIDDLEAAPTEAERLSNGNTVVVTNKGHVVEYARDKSIVWQSRFEGPLRDVRALPNGHLLVLVAADWGQVIELDEARQEVWRSPQMNPGHLAISVSLDHNGWLLIATYGTGQILRMDRAGETAALPGRFEKLRQVEQLADGTLLVLDVDGVHLTDAEGHKIKTVVEQERIERFDCR
jgi:hypothetical protein